MFQRGWFLVDVPDAILARAIVDVVQRYGVVRALRFGEDATSAALLADPGRVAGSIVRVDGDGGARLRDLRACMPALPILALSTHASWDLINAAQWLGIEFAQLPVQTPNLVAFVQRALSASFLPHDGVARVIAELAHSRGLTAREVQILAYCLGNEPRKRVRRRLGIAENTLKTQIRALLRKCDERSVDGLAKNVLRAALLTRWESNETVASWWRSGALRDTPHLAAAG